MATQSNESILAGAKQALKNADNFGQRETGNKKAGDPPAKPAAASNYSHAREARKSPGEFMGIKSDQAGDIKAALATREANKKALEPNQ